MKNDYEMIEVETQNEEWMQENNAENPFADDRGIGVIELALILVILIGLVVLFKDQLSSIMSTVFEKVNAAIGKL